MAISTEFKNRFIDLIDELGIENKTEIAKAIGLTYPTFSNICKYGILPTVPILIRIADYFNISLDYLTGKTDNEKFYKSANPKTFYERLEELRIRDNIPSVYNLADKIHFHRNNIAQWKKHNYLPSIDDIELIADYFNVSIDYLLGRTDDRTPY